MQLGRGVVYYYQLVRSVGGLQVGYAWWQELRGKVGSMGARVGMQVDGQFR
jgi:hypothetical protein